MGLTDLASFSIHRTSRDPYDGQFQKMVLMQALIQIKDLNIMF